MIVSFASDVAPPARFPSPFGPPHPLAEAAARDLMAHLPALVGASPREGKMFGVLVVPGGYLRAFSGMLDGSWQVAGFVPPLFDLAARDAFWIAGERELIEREAGIAAARDGGGARAVVEARMRAELDALVATHREAKRGRAVRRARGGDLEALATESRRDTTERRALEARHARERTALAGPDVAALVAARADRSRELLHQIHATYRVPLRELFAPGEPPGGAGDCAAPKLLAHASAHGLQPLALAEFWWGPGERHQGAFYPACRGKCGPILPMLVPANTEPAPVFGGGPIAADEPRVVWEDAQLAIVDKPVGLLSVPGRSGHLRDSVLVRVLARWPGATVVHRLDLETSGLMLVAKGAETHARLQRAFASREIDKRYVAWLDGRLIGQLGVIELPLRVDLDDRPRQIVDHAHGKAALTEWRVIAREPTRTRVALTPRTGRTHQLRVHCATGLGVPIVGDRLYGRAAERMYLHAEALAFAHPHTGERIAVERPPQW